MNWQEKLLILIWIMNIKPIAKSEKHFLNWVDVYPFYANVKKEGVKLFDAA